MSRKQWLAAGSLVLLVSYSATYFAPALGGEEIKDKGKDDAPALSRTAQREIERAMENPKEFSLTLTYQSFKGSPSELGSFLRQFMAEFLAQDLGRHLTDEKDPKPWAILHSDPAKEKSITIDVGYGVKAEPKLKAPLAVRRVSMTKAIRYTYSGDPTGLTQVYAHMVSSSQGGKPKPDFPVALHMLTNPSRVTDASEIKTEIVVPVK